MGLPLELLMIIFITASPLGVISISIVYIYYIHIYSVCQSPDSIFYDNPHE